MSDTPSRAFAIYPSLEHAAVIVTGGASGIGMEIVRAIIGRSRRRRLPQRGRPGQLLQRCGHPRIHRDQRATIGLIAAMRIRVA